MSVSLRVTYGEWREMLAGRPLPHPVWCRDTESSGAIALYVQWPRDDIDEEIMAMLKELRDD